jgi:hypothetical protein
LPNTIKASTSVRANSVATSVSVSSALISTKV